MSALIAVQEAPTASDLDAADARRLTDQIKLALDATWEAGKRAWEGRAWIALGYDSWDEYCTREFGTSHLRLPREDRDSVIPSLRAAGMSGRAIGALTGLNERTVRRSLAEVSAAANAAPDSGLALEPEAAPAAPAATGADGKAYPTKRTSRADVLERQTKASLLRGQGMSQMQIADQLKVAQATVSADLAEIDKIQKAHGVVLTQDSVSHVFTDDGRTDVGALGDLLGVEVTPVRDLARLARQPMTSVVTTLDVLLDVVVNANEWLDAGQRKAAAAVIVPNLTRAAALIGTILGALSGEDIDPDQLITLREGLVGLTRHVPGGAL